MSHNIYSTSLLDDGYTPSSTITISQPSSWSNTNIPPNGIVTTTGSAGGYYIASSSLPNPMITINEGSKALTVVGDAEFKGDLKLDGVSLRDTLKNIESRLNILRPNQDVEARWSELKELGDKYRALEADILAKEELITLLMK